MNQALNVILGGALPVQADSTEAYCQLSRHDHTLPLEGGQCIFSQRQGNVNITFNRTTYHFPANEQGTGYQRSANAEGLRFNREGDYTLNVLWRRQYSCGDAMQTPVSAVFVNTSQPPSVERWEDQGTTTINWCGRSLTCSS